MKRSESYLCHVEMKDGVPFGKGLEIIERSLKALKEVEAMTNVKGRVRFTARGKRGIKLADCKTAAVYIYMKRIKK